MATARGLLEALAEGQEKAAWGHGRQAIKYGRFFIEIAGRYPTGTVAANTPANMMRTAQLFPAYEAIALACVEATSLERHKSPAFTELCVKMVNDQATPPA